MSGSDGNKLLWEVVDNHVVYIGIRWFNFNFFDEDEEVMVKELLIKYPYLLILLNLSPGDWKNQFESVNMKVDEENGKSVGMVNVRSWKIGGFSDPTFGLGGSRLWEKEDAQKISGKKRKTR